VDVGEVGKGAGVHLVNRLKGMVLMSILEVEGRMVVVGVEVDAGVGTSVGLMLKGIVKRISLVDDEGIALTARVVCVELGVGAVEVDVGVEEGGRLRRTVKLKSSGNAEGPRLVLTEVGDSDATCFPLNVIERVLVGFSCPVSGSIRRR